jgi:hypothetical protein
VAEATHVWSDGMARSTSEAETSLGIGRLIEPFFLAATFLLEGSGRACLLLG